MSGEAARGVRTGPAPAPTRSWVKFEYRPALNGLRAIAALLVVFFHAGMPGMDNGYVGVDVFFVLSGFLITSLIAREFLVEHRIHMFRFYARRARRLFPAALLVLLATAVVYQMTAPALDVLENRWGFAAAAMYVSNWFFLAQSQDYFAQEASPSPVLHYWSLSVEEQFYLAWPVLMLLLFAIPAFRRRFGPYVVAVLAVGAFVLSAWLATGANPMTSYFGTFGRAYQLLLGAALAMALLWLAKSGREAPRALRRIAPVTLLLGVVLLVVASTSIGPATPFWVGVYGCLATVLILASLEFGARGPAHALLAAPAAVWLGVWSYSIYLWHWPVVVLGDLNGWLPQAWYFRVPMVTALSIGLAALTWLLIERPANAIRMKTLSQQRRVVVSGLVGTVGTAIVCTAVLWPSAATQTLYDTAFEGAKHGFSGTWVGGDKQADRTLLVIGDSHAMFWRAGLNDLALQRGFKLVFVTRSACPWMAVDAVSINSGEDYECDRRLQHPAMAAIRKYQPDATVLISRSMTVRDLRTAEGTQIPVGGPGWDDEVRTGMAAFLDEVGTDAGKIAIIEPMPETAGSMLTCLSTGVPDTDCAQPQRDSVGITTVEELQREAVQGRAGVVSVSLDELICPSGTCPARVDGVITHRDTNHLTDQYATAIVPAVVAALRDSGVDLPSSDARE